MTKRDQFLNKMINDVLRSTIVLWWDSDPGRRYLSYSHSLTPSRAQLLPLWRRCRLHGGHAQNTNISCYDYSGMHSQENQAFLSSWPEIINPPPLIYRDFVSS